MKLIDADKYRDSLEESWKKCHEWHDEADTEEIRIRAEQAEITFMECILRLNDQPTVDAIPVEWIEQYLYDLAVGNEEHVLNIGEILSMSDEEYYLKHLIKRWEQEKQNGNN